MSDQVHARKECPLGYADLAELNTSRLILDSVGASTLKEIANNYLNLLETAGAIYEANGDYALGIFSSGWCHFLENASRQLCNTEDNAEALKCGKWICHECCWSEAALESIKTKNPVDIECKGGIRLYAVPILSGCRVVGSINIGYGSPPTDPAKLQEISERYEVDLDELIQLAKEYKSSSPQIINAAKSQLVTSARLIGQIIERKQAEADKELLITELDERVKELKCLYRISRLVTETENPLDELLLAIIDVIPPSWQYPEITGVRMTYKKQVFATSNFKDTPWIQKQLIYVENIPVGSLEICYLEEMPVLDEGPFSKEERELVNAIAEQVGQIIGKNLSLYALKDSYKYMEKTVEDRTRKLSEAIAQKENAKIELQTIFDNVPYGIVSFDREMRVVQKNSICMQNYSLQKGNIIDPNVCVCQQELYNIGKYTLETQKAVKDYRIECKPGTNSHQTLLLDSVFLKDVDNVSSGVLILMRDISRLANLENQLCERQKFKEIVGKSKSMQEIFTRIEQFANIENTVLIQGESGTGKEMVVDAFHSFSLDDGNRPLVRLNCSTLSEHLLESELFGHVRGAFTGALSDRIGRVQAAEGGILFLDEIGDISPRIQLKLLRFLERKEYEMVGDSKTITANLRVITATNVDLAAKVRQGVFREDLYYRLKVLVITLPPLRKRREDIPLLIEHFIDMFNRVFNKHIEGVSAEVFQFVMNYSWPGNIRELKHAIEHACLVCLGNEIQIKHFPDDLLSSRLSSPMRALETKDEVSKEDILFALQKTDWNKAKTARILGVARSTLYIKLQQYRIHPPS